MLKLALPAGDVRRPLAQILARAGLAMAGYGEGSRSYRLRPDCHDGILPRIFREKDIPIQIALGNYDVGVCGLAWVEEFLARYPREAIVKVGDLGVGTSRLYVAAAAGTLASLQDTAALQSPRIAGEFPNLAEAFAMTARLPRYHILPVAGAAEAYPPEDADLALVACPGEQDLMRLGLTPIHLLLENSAWLIAHRQSLEEKDLSPILGPLLALPPIGVGEPRLNLPAPPPPGPSRGGWGPSSDKLRLALPDGHLQRAAFQALTVAGMAFTGYSATEFGRRPESALPGLKIKVLRPQDMPRLVAEGSFELAICGRDCLRDHLYRFPSSPVEELVDLGKGRFDLCAVVSNDLPAATLAEALATTSGATASYPWPAPRRGSCLRTPTFSSRGRRRARP
jgi:ATP phosphoribosyltransferase